MKLLALDSSTDIARIALSDGRDCLLRELTGVRTHAKNMLSQIDELLAQASWSLSMLDGLVFGCGPGSFTGLRVSCSLAQGIAYAQDLPLYPVSSLASIAEKVRENNPDADVLAVLDARMKQLYWSFIPAAASFASERVSDARDIHISAPSCILAGKGYDAYLAELQDSTRDKIANYIEQGPDAAAMIRLVLEQRIKPVSVAEAQPVYIRNDVTQGGPNG